MTRTKRFTGISALVAAGFLVGVLAGPPAAQAIDVGDILKGGGIAAVVSIFGDEINSFINTILLQREAEIKQMTKVVPVVRVGGGGGGTAVGAVQVQGPREQVRLVQAVVEVELKVGNRVRGRALLPVTTKEVYTSTIRSVGGVGVSANIKHPL
ncbi:MAG: hypothetical protein HPY44_11140 [Armatimonadetes bacterium]|nr:hypothetical protein [Armatimonadota bacterium]